MFWNPSCFGLGKQLIPARTLDRYTLKISTPVFANRSAGRSPCKPIPLWAPHGEIVHTGIVCSAAHAIGVRNPCISPKKSAAFEVAADRQVATSSESDVRVDYRDILCLLLQQPQARSQRQSFATSCVSLPDAWFRQSFFDFPNLGVNAHSALLRSRNCYATASPGLEIRSDG